MPVNWTYRQLLCCKFFQYTEVNRKLIEIDRRWNYSSFLDQSSLKSSYVILWLDAELTTTVIIDAMLRFSDSSNPRLSNLAQIYLTVRQQIVYLVYKIIFFMLYMGRARCPLMKFSEWRQIGATALGWRCSCLRCGNEGIHKMKLARQCIADRRQCKPAEKASPQQICIILHR